MKHKRLGWSVSDNKSDSSTKNAPNGINSTNAAESYGSVTPINGYEASDLLQLPVSAAVLSVRWPRLKFKSQQNTGS